MIDYSVHIDAPAEVVFDMFTDGDLLTEWMAREAKVDPNPGGQFRWVYENGDVVVGRFVEIDRPRRIVMRYGWETPVSRGIPPSSTEVEITFQDDAGATLLRLVHRGLPPAELATHRAGWEYFIGRLATRLAASDLPKP